MTTLSIIIPAYNEENTLASCVAKVKAIESAELQLEIIIVDDASADATPQIGQQLAKDFANVSYLRQSVNCGKGAALRMGFQKATGDIVAVQDADLEYDPKDLLQLVAPIIDGRADVVIGSRFMSGQARRVLYFWHFMANRFLTFCSNMFTNLNLSDMETCYKIFKREIIQDIDLKENRFGFEPEIVAKISRYRINGQHLKVYEMGISYSGRTYEEGKKIGWKDGVRALYAIVKYGVFN